MSVNRIQSDPSVVQAVPSISFVAAPVSEGDLCGTIDYSINGSALFTAELVAAESIDTQSSELSVSTVATPAPEVNPPEQKGWFSSLPGWLPYVLGALVLAAAGAVVYFTVIRKYIKARKRRSR
ncbi:hypothetical protein SDC9_187134 [bioreactor metagenome]|uniref:Uncharacterized protein n=1 Tax=bioreactor metagenome TaxID=1076179 RepID=A0A645HM35_9ZZZZ